MLIRSQPLTQQSFDPFGQVLEMPSAASRIYFSDALANARPHARPSLSLAVREPTALPLAATILERHEFSSQTFIATDVSRWLVMVAPHLATGGPDMSKARAFLPAPGQGVTFGANVWHHPLTVFDRPAAFAIYMWLDGTAGDEEFFTLSQPLQVEIE
jgi:ureidoglycolate lyase